MPAIIKGFRQVAGHGGLGPLVIAGGRVHHSIPVGHVFLVLGYPSEDQVVLCKEKYGHLHWFYRAQLTLILSHEGVLGIHDWSAIAEFSDPV